MFIYAQNVWLKIGLLFILNIYFEDTNNENSNARIILHEFEYSILWIIKDYDDDKDCGTKNIICLKLF